MSDAARRVAAVPRIGSVEQARRRAAIDEARHSSALEGVESSSAVRELQEQYVRGEIATADELVARTQALYRKRG